MSASGDHRPVLSPATFNPNTNPKPSLIGVNSGTGILISAQQGFSFLPPSRSLLPRRSFRLERTQPLRNSSRRSRRSSPPMAQFARPSRQAGSFPVPSVRRPIRSPPSSTPASSKGTLTFSEFTRFPLPPQRPVVPVRSVPVHAGVSGPPRIGAPVVHMKVNSFSTVLSTSDLNNYKNMRDQSGENAGTVVINGRKVEGSVEDLSTREILQFHIKRAKKVRTRLREERLHRIDRFKQRLALLLPPSLEQNKIDTGAGS